LYNEFEFIIAYYQIIILTIIYYILSLCYYLFVFLQIHQFLFDELLLRTNKVLPGVCVMKLYTLIFGYLHELKLNNVIG